MKCTSLILFFSLVVISALTQDVHYIDSLKEALSRSKEDTNKVKLYADLSWRYQWAYPDSALFYSLPGLQLARELHFDKGEIDVLLIMGEALATKGNYSKALELELKALEVAEKLHNEEKIKKSLVGIGAIYHYSGDYEKALYYYKKAKENNYFFLDNPELILGFIGESYFHLNKFDSALLYIKEAYDLDVQSSSHWSIPYFYMGLIQAEKENYKEALDYYRVGISVSDLNAIDPIIGYNGIAAVFKKSGNTDSAIYYAKKAITTGQIKSFISEVVKAATLLTEIYTSKHITDSAFKYQTIMLSAKDSLFSQEKVKQLQNLSFNEQLRQQEIQQEQEQFKSRLKIYALIAAILVFLVITLFLLRSNRYKQKAYTLLQQQKLEIETQNAKAQIDASLELVRARATAMHDSKDVSNAIGVLFSELDKLGINTFRCGILIIEEPKTLEIWTATSTEEGEVIQVSGKLDKTIHPLLQGIYDSWEQKNSFYSYELIGEDMLNYYNSISGSSDYLIPSNTFHFSDPPNTSKQFCSVFFFREGGLFALTSDAFSEEKKSVLEKFAAVFGLTYRRYLDLKQAEAHAKEAQIEEALAKVRSRSLAMHKSDELQQVVNSVFESLKELGVPLDSANIIIFEEGSKDFAYWNATNTNQIYSSRFLVPYATNALPLLTGLNKAKESGQELYTRSCAFEEKNELFLNLFEHSDFKNLSEERKKFILESKRFTISVALIKNIGIQINSYSRESFSEKDNEILKKFTKVFDQAYIRFLDLQKVEAQAREATIEASLEKVRGRAMAMHNSNDLSATAGMVFTEMRKLGISSIHSGVGLLDKESGKAQLYSATTSPDGDGLALIGWVILSGHPVLENTYEAWLKNEDYFPVLSGEQLKSYYELPVSGLAVPSVPDWQAGQKQYGYFLPFSVGSLYAWSENPYNDAGIKILKRFTSIIDLTFRRYVELQKSEANAREKVKSASLDRVRAETASMRKTADLEKITPLIWNELTTLGVPFIRCGVFIMDEQHEQIRTFLSTPDGKAIAAFHLPYNTPGTSTQVLEYWRKKEIYKEHWDEKAFLEWTKNLVDQGAIASQEKYLTERPPTNLDLHFFPFLQGMLYVGSETPLDEEEIKLVQALADSFSTAYARYEDFNKLESAKEQIEKTLVDLKQAQTQLIQSEKMASLGELTAGIAHEIQNPLNFVNNFSEVSNELLDEMITELENNKKEDAIAIADNLKQNLGKILQHGKRADGIVKGMLQHSRSSSAVKEPTDINKLADEYLRLAYHGLRAKDKSFNATLKTDYDESIGNINIIPQDIGRAILNLITNAFYAVTEKKKNSPLTPALGGGTENPQHEYEPTVTVSTKKINDKIEVRVKDNGNGIPQKVLDKIFQPFFTTKPTGQGTGLGLSLAYDIVKARGGEIKVETKESEGAEFIIQLPIV